MAISKAIYVKLQETITTGYQSRVGTVNQYNQCESLIRFDGLSPNLFVMISIGSVFVVKPLIAVET